MTIKKINEEEGNKILSLLQQDSNNYLCIIGSKYHVGVKDKVINSVNPIVFSDYEEYVQYGKTYKGSDKWGIKRSKDFMETLLNSKVFRETLNFSQADNNVVSFLSYAQSGVSLEDYYNCSLDSVSHKPINSLLDDLLYKYDKARTETTNHTTRYMKNFDLGMRLEGSRFVIELIRKRVYFCEHCGYYAYNILKDYYSEEEIRNMKQSEEEKHLCINIVDEYKKDRQKLVNKETAITVDDFFRKTDFDTYPREYCIKVLEKKYPNVDVEEMEFTDEIALLIIKCLIKAQDYILDNIVDWLIRNCYTL